MITPLDPQQRLAVETDARRVLVLAGAGSGKTRVLVERIAHLIEERHASPYEICSFTFTRKAAGEMSARLKERLGSRAHHVTARTMHSLALNMVHRFGELIGLRPQNITVYSEWESEFLLREAATDVGVYKKGKWKIQKKLVDEVFALYYSQGVPPAPGHCLRELFDAFISRCRENNALTYGALLIALHFLLDELGSLLKYRYILVDEVQDIDALQWAIIEGLVRVFDAELFVVGDVDQSIYEWRGAVPDRLVQTADSFSIFRLETNYRSSAGIVNCANRLIDFNRMRLPKTMMPIFRGDAEDVLFRRDVDSAGVVSLVADPVPLLVTVLARNHVLLQKVSDLLGAREVPHFYVGKKTALVNSEVFRRVHAFFKLLVNPYDNFAFLLIRERIGIDAVAYGEIRSAAAHYGLSHFETWMQSAVGPWADFFRNEQHHDSLFTAASELHRLIPAQGAFFAIEETMSFIYSWMAGNPAPTWEGENPICRYLDWLALYDIQDEIGGIPPGITLMTIHAAKGLEFDTVLVAGCNEGLLPSSQSVKADDGGRALEAERRLAYVAWTRAKHLLVLTVRPEATEVNGRVYESPESRFISESF